LLDVNWLERREWLDAVALVRVAAINSWNLFGTHQA